MGRQCTISDVVHHRPLSSFIFTSGVFLLVHHSFLHFSFFSVRHSLFFPSFNLLSLSQSRLSLTPPATICITLSPPPSPLQDLFHSCFSLYMSLSLLLVSFFLSVHSLPQVQGTPVLAPKPNYYCSGKLFPLFMSCFSIFGKLMDMGCYSVGVAKN